MCYNLNPSKCFKFNGKSYAHNKLDWKLEWHHSEMYWCEFCKLPIKIPTRNYVFYACSYCPDIIQSWIAQKSSLNGKLPCTFTRQIMKKWQTVTLQFHIEFCSHSILFTHYLLPNRKCYDEHSKKCSLKQALLYKYSYQS